MNFFFFNSKLNAFPTSKNSIFTTFIMILKIPIANNKVILVKLLRKFLYTPIAEVMLTYRYKQIGRVSTGQGIP